MNVWTRKSKVVLSAVVAAILAGFALLYLVVGERVSAQERQAPPQSLMQMKLQHAQTMLSAIAMEDFERIGTSARRMSELSVEAQWTRPGSTLYGVYGDQFRAALADVEKSVDARNLEGVTLNFFQVVMACVKCHEVVRAGHDVATIELPDEWRAHASVGRDAD